eukprot:11997187-Prorocentrum_lima.AAC.1
MTSSLVGSEMCIRDSTKTNDQEEGTYFVGQGHYVLEVLERLSSSMHYKTCLLYTSDAADDM